MDVFNVSSDSLFTFSSQQNAAKENLALRALNTGLGQFSAKDYESAISNFKRAIAMAPQSDAALNAYDYMARAQLTQGDTDAAVATYQKALRIAPNRDDLRMQLGKIFTSNGRNDEALEQYELAVKANPDAANRYALGQGYLGVARYDDALLQFEQVQREDAKNPFGYYGQGLAYAKQGDFESAIAAFKNAIKIQYDYADAYTELGYAYTDNGQTDLAQETSAALATYDADLAGLLNQYIYEQTQPKMVSAYVPELYTPFLATRGPGTQLSSLSAYLNSAGAQQTFAMTFQFDKPMDRASVENVFNWSINRAQGTGRADGYNYDMVIPSSEVSILQTPMSVTYNETEQTATVAFQLRQNDTATGTIDPSHINFTFTGKDLVGNKMDQSADMYSGFSGFA